MATKMALSELNDKIDNILEILKTQSDEIKKVNTQLTEQLEKVKKLEATVTTLDGRVLSLEKENLKLKTELNNNAQLSKANTIRLLGYPSTDEESKSVDGGKAFFSSVFDRILRPILSVAASKGECSPVTHMSSAVYNIFRAGRPKPGTNPPPIIITFTSPQFRLAVLRNKRNNIGAPSPSERLSGIKGFSLVEDLTPSNYKMLNDLRRDERVASVWSREGRIKFLLSADKNTIHTVSSVFDPVSSILDAIIT